MKHTFNKALAHILAYEGGYVDHPVDPGGATNMGITRKTLSRFRQYPASKEDVKQLTSYEAQEIYRTLYWHMCVCELLPMGIDLSVFDCAVNQGVRRSTYFLQKAAKVKTDNIIGPITLNAVRLSNPVNLLNEFTAFRMKHYGGLSGLFRTFGLGWSRRLSATHTKSLQLIMENKNELLS